MIKQILRLLFLLAMYELGKYVTDQVYIMMTANDDVEAPIDFVFLSEVSERCGLLLLLYVLYCY
ncbi:transcriptional activator RinB [Staphylococcus aureus]|uniref:transcriptional activator RinB n=1 Tax=Staphylococcus aureus TaxID=1280 RepID=UPI00210A33B7|nr:transcriptional activator RinB [Staphylococcus aureus]